MLEKALLMLFRIGLWLPLIVWMALIFLFSTDLFSGRETASVFLPILGLLLGWAVPDQFLNTIHFLIRKGAHFTEYMVLGLLWYRAVNPTLRNWRLKSALWAFLLSSIYAAVDEFHQAFTMTRDGRVADVIIDSSGALAAVIAVWFYNKVLTGLRADEHR